MSILRWTVYDPLDVNPVTNHFTFPINPASATSPYPERSIQSMTSTRGTTLFTEGGAQAKQWQFSGPILNKDQFELLRVWTYEKPGRLLINDHFGRKIRCMWTNFDAVPKRRPNIYYSHDYTISALVFEITAPTVPNAGYGV